MKTLFLCLGMLLLYFGSHAQDTIVSKFNSSFSCDIKSIDGYYLIVETKFGSGETSKIPMNQIYAIKIADSTKAARFKAESPAIGLLIEQYNNPLTIDSGRKIELELPLNAGTDLKQAGNRLLIGAILTFGGLFVGNLPAVAASGNSNFLISTTSFLGLCFQLSGYLKLNEAGRKLERDLRKLK